MSYFFDFSVIATYSGPLLVGTYWTILASLISIIIGTIGAIVLALMRSSENPYFRWPAIFFIELMRGLPFIVFLIWVYFALPLLVPFRISIFAAVIFTLSASLAAFAAEIIRAGIESVPKGQIHAAQTLGLTRWQIIQTIMLPQIMRKELSPIIGSYLYTFKLTAVATVIAFPELLHQSSVIIAATYRPLEIYTAMAVIFLLLSLPFTYFSHRFEYKRQFLRNDLA